MELFGIGISLLAVVIAYSQWAIADQRVRIELFQQRNKIYRTVQEVLLECLEPEGPTDKGTRDLLLATSEARWMFNEKIYEFLDKRILEDCVILKSTRSLIREALQPDSKHKLFERQNDLQRKLHGYLIVLPSICGPMLNIERGSLTQNVAEWRLGVYRSWREWFNLDS